MKVTLVGGRGWDCNQFLIKSEKGNWYDLVDAGHGLDFENVLAEVAKITDPHRIRSVAISHEHLDHVNGLPKWQELGAKIITSPTTAQKLAVGRDPTSEQFGASIVKLSADQEVGEGDTITLGDWDFSVIPSPGHSPGSTCYWHEPSGTLFSGDVLFAGGGIGRFDFPDSNLADHYESILRLGKLPVRNLHCGHGPSEHDDNAARSVRGSMAHVTACYNQR